MFEGTTRIYSTTLLFNTLLQGLFLIMNVTDFASYADDNIPYLTEQQVLLTKLYSQVLVIL